MKKTTSLPIAISGCALIIILTRIALILIFSLFSYLTDDPGSTLPISSGVCRAVCDALCGIIIAGAMGKDFSRSSRVFFAVFSVILISVVELLLGRLIFPKSNTAFYMIPISVLAAFIGALLASVKNGKKRPRHKRR